MQGTVEQWPDADKVDLLRHLRDLTEDQLLASDRHQIFMGKWSLKSFNLPRSLP